MENAVFCVAAQAGGRTFIRGDKAGEGEVGHIVVFAGISLEVDFTQDGKKRTLVYPWHNVQQYEPEEEGE